MTKNYKGPAWRIRQHERMEELDMQGRHGEVRKIHEAIYNDARIQAAYADGTDRMDEVLG